MCQAGLHATLPRARSHLACCSCAHSTLRGMQPQSREPWCHDEHAVPIYRERCYGGAAPRAELLEVHHAMTTPPTSSSKRGGASSSAGSGAKRADADCGGGGGGGAVSGARRGLGLSRGGGDGTQRSGAPSDTSSALGVGLGQMVAMAKGHRQRSKVAETSGDAQPLAGEPARLAGGNKNVPDAPAWEGEIAGDLTPPPTAGIGGRRAGRGARTQRTIGVHASPRSGGTARGNGGTTRSWQELMNPVRPGKSIMAIMAGLGVASDAPDPHDVGSVTQDPDATFRRDPMARWSAWADSLSA